MLEKFHTHKMKEIIKIAWRNLWRNKRRTIITAASIFFAVFFAIAMRGLQLGTYDHMIKQSIEAYAGYLQVQHPDYSDDPGIDNAFAVSPEMMRKINAVSNVRVAVPRIESAALASNGNLSKGVVVAGISPSQEREMANPEQKLVRYRITRATLDELKRVKSFPEDVLEKVEENMNLSFVRKRDLIEDLGLLETNSQVVGLILKNSSIPSVYLTMADNGVLVSDRLSKYLKLNIGDSLVLMGQGYQGASAAGIYPVRGIVKIPAPDLDNKLVYMTIDKAGEFLGMYGRITSIAINLHNADDMDNTLKELEIALKDENVSVKNWETLMPTLKQQIEGDNSSGMVYVGVLYLIIFFGIFGTVMMMISERRHEFGVMVAIGMKRGKLAGTVAVEMLFLGFIGTAAGMLATVPVVLYGYYHPIKISGDMGRMYTDMGFDPVMPIAWFDTYFAMQGAVVLLMVLLATYFPIRGILKLNVIKAIHG